MRQTYMNLGPALTAPTLGCQPDQQAIAMFPKWPNYLNEDNPYELHVCRPTVLPRRQET